jgi:molecular chaperone GrpE
MTTDTPLPEDAAQPAAGEPTAAELNPENKIAELEGRLAEVENVRRRADEDISKARKFAVEGFAEAMLPVMDSLEAAIATPSASVDTVLEGVHATRRQLSSALERNKVIEINPAAGTKFDPHQHQAISMVPAEQDANTVVTVLQKGFLIADRVLRPALVTVAAPK